MKRLTFLLLGVFFLFSFSCGDNNDNITNNNEKGEVSPYELTEAELEFLEELMLYFDQFPIVEVDTNDIMFPGGFRWNDVSDDLEPFIGTSSSNETFPKTNASQPIPSSFDGRNRLMKQIVREAEFLTQRRNFIKPAGANANEPAQPHGLAYVWNGKRITSRTRPGYHHGVRHCDDVRLYGLDCSGFIHQAFSRANIPLPVGFANDQRQPRVIANAIRTRYPDLRVAVRDLGRLDVDSCRVGDIIYFQAVEGGRANHIKFFVSEGRLAYSSGGPRACTHNAGPSGGPLIKDIAWVRDFLNEPRRHYGVVRITIADPWTLGIRCEGRDSDFLTTTLSIFEAEDLDEWTSVISSDYVGTLLYTDVQLQYDKDTKILSLQTTLYVAGGRREDVVQVRLDEDDSGYLDMQNIRFVDITGCPLQIRLVRGEHRSLPQSLYKIADGTASPIILAEPL